MDFRTAYRSHLLSSLRRLDDLTHEARVLDKQMSPLDYDRVMTQLLAANEVNRLDRLTLPRGYEWQDNSQSKHGFYLKLNGRKVSPEQFALDLATGWMDEVCDLIDTTLSKRYPQRLQVIPAIEAPQKEGV